MLETPSKRRVYGEWKQMFNCQGLGQRAQFRIIFGQWQGKKRITNCEWECRIEKLGLVKL
jgi:hypothetical protein